MNKWWIKSGVGMAVLGLLLGAGWEIFWAAPHKGGKKEKVFVVGRKIRQEQVGEKLEREGFIRSQWGFGLVWSWKGEEIKPGGYRLSKGMNAWQVAEKLAAEPVMVWVVVPEGWRKEQIGEELAEKLGWSGEELERWNEIYTAMKYDYMEGVYFSDTYLIPREESGLEVAQRLRRNFEEKFKPFYGRFLEKNIKWTTGLKIASLIQREAAGEEDMPLIAGVIWNRLEEGMKLEIDATLQYVKGKGKEGWWGSVKPEDKELDSPYNTYLYEGLPPHPIANPGLAAIEAVLEPAETEGLYYLHDSKGQIHCAESYQEHKENIEEYLRD